MEPLCLTGEAALEEEALGTTQQDQDRADMARHLALPLAWPTPGSEYPGLGAFLHRTPGFRDLLERDSEGRLSPAPA